LHVGANALIAFWGIYFIILVTYNQNTTSIIIVLFIYATLMKHGFKLEDSLEQEQS
jgi:hypothetical protein